MPPWLTDWWPAVPTVVLPLFFFLFRPSLVRREDMNRAISDAITAERARWTTEFQSLAATVTKLNAVLTDLHADHRLIADRMDRGPSNDALSGLTARLAGLTEALEGQREMQAQILRIVERHEHIIAAAAARAAAP